MRTSCLFLILSELIHYVSCGNVIPETDTGHLLQATLEHGISNQVYPGAVAAYGTYDSVIYEVNVGSFTYDNASPPMTLQTLFDVASLTKVIATTTSMAKLYEDGFVTLDSHVHSILGDEFNTPNASKANITVRHCLTHTAGFPPDPVPWYWSDDSTLCPLHDDDDGGPLPEDFSCLPSIYGDFIHQYIATDPGLEYVYSDLSFITLQFVIGKVVLDNDLVSSDAYSATCQEDSSGEYSVNLSCAYEAYVRQHVLSPVLPNSSFLPDPSRWPNTAPTLNDSEYTMVMPLQGQVGDGDCYAMGGIAGHAGLFSDLADVSRIAMSWLSSVNNNQEADDYTRGQQSSRVNIPAIINATTANVFSQISNAQLSSRALGWDTNLQSVNDYGFDGVCGEFLSNRTFLHIGYTGTCLCIDPVNAFWSVILTNRAYGCQVKYHLWMFVTYFFFFSFC